MPPGERMNSRAYKAHGISSQRLAREGVRPTPGLLEFHALVTAALAANVTVVAHNASFDVRALNHTAHRFRLTGCTWSSATMLCTMHNATKHCGLRKRGNKALKAPRNEELYHHLFKRKPAGPLHRALPDCRVTLACYVKGRELKWW